jgi:hypothetical protein
VSDVPCSPVEEIPASSFTHEARTKVSPSSGNDSSRELDVNDLRPSRAVNRSSISLSSSSDSDDFESLPITKKMLAGRRAMSPSPSASTTAAAHSPSDSSMRQQQQQQQQFTPPDSGMRHITPVGSPRKPSNPYFQVTCSNKFKSQRLYASDLTLSLCSPKPVSSSNPRPSGGLFL